MSLEDGAKELSNNSEETTEINVAAENGKSRFSEDDMDTEVEVSPEENSEEKPRRKKWKKPDEKTAKENEEKKTKDDERATTKVHPENNDDEKKKTKRNFKKEINNLVDAPFILCAGVLVCVVLPFSIYACDVIISVNVIGGDNYRNAIISRTNNMSQLPYPKHLIGEKYPLQEDTLFHIIQINSNPKNHHTKVRTKSQTPDDEPVLIESASDTALASTVPAKTTLLTKAKPPANTTIKSSISASPRTPASSPNTTSASTERGKNTTFTSPSKKANSSLAAAVDSNATIVLNTTVKTTALKPKNTTHRKPAKYIPRPAFRFTTLKTSTTDEPEEITIDPELWKRQPYEYCFGLYYFYDLHIRYANEYGSDWFQDQITTVYQKEQTLFFLFTIIGFISLLIGLGLRCDAFLSDEWSSFILVNLFLYSISMAVTVSIFAQETARGGLRCATCRFTVNCSDIDPWNYHNRWPANYDKNWSTDTGTIKWSMVALVSFVLKFIDCYSIAIVTLKFIIDVAADLWWVTCLKVFGWLVVFPLLIFTPMLGVVRFQALPAVAPYDAVSMLASEVFFYIGIVFWALVLIATPFFCKIKMCSGSGEDERQEEEEIDY